VQSSLHIGQYCRGSPRRRHLRRHLRRHASTGSENFGLRCWAPTLGSDTFGIPNESPGGRNQTGLRVGELLLWACGLCLVAEMSAYLFWGSRYEVFSRCVARCAGTPYSGLYPYPSNNPSASSLMQLQLCHQSKKSCRVSCLEIHVIPKPQYHDVCSDTSR
jgi:hypothetical protein